MPENAVSIINICQVKRKLNMASQLGGDSHHGALNKIKSVIVNNHNMILQFKLIRVEQNSLATILKIWQLYKINQINW